MDNVFVVVALFGDIDVVSTARIDRELRRLDGSTPYAIVDLTGVGYLDTTLLRALIRTRRRIAEDGRDVRIAIVAPCDGPARRLFDVATAAGTFALFEDRSSARRSFFALVPPLLETPA